MLAIYVKTEGRQRHLRPTARQLDELVHRIGAEGDRFLVVERIPDLPDVFIQVWHKAGGDYTLEHRDGAHDRHFQVRLDGPEAVVTAMLGWARLEDGWDAGPDWTLLDMGPAPEPAPELAPEDREQIEELVRGLLAGGYGTRAELAEAAEEYLVDGDRRPVSSEQARQLVDRLWLERVAEQAGWEGETDPERLTRAFAALEASGVTAREHFTCCRSCGQAEIGGAGSPGARGFVYFHTQCTDAAAAGHGLTLLYGGFDGSEETTAAIGREVVAALAEAGLRTDWSGDPGQGITVTPLDWRKRLVG
ncbi:DUF6891 domain-containing protein [Streptomyces sp. FIT100]|uniref:DUF6891 domain-containing protein n=1 Tax=Streptomyces sp. FIT100 TaxID=2837956 RepID=UPI0021C9F815|nr:hypothetical protein [Streptomyces sp. FIT100]UUN31102.1 hypothetical protein KK483_08880 [Streptomyces sp. FIT100]